MTFRRLGFTLVELMIVIAIIGILASSIYPAASAYYARGRDVARISDIKFLSANFQNYARTNNTYPSNQKMVRDLKKFCISEIFTWADVSTQQDRLFRQLGGTGALREDPVTSNANIGLCTQNGSYFYARHDKETSYSVLAARMERQTTGANFSDAVKLSNPGYLDEILRAQPLDKSGDDLDKLFLIVTN